MKIVKPNKQESVVIAFVIGAGFGLVVSFLSMKEKVEEAEFERNLMMYHAEEMTEMNEVLMMQMEHMEEK